MAIFTHLGPFLISFLFHSFFYAVQTVFEGFFQVLGHFLPLEIQRVKNSLSWCRTTLPNAERKGTEKREQSSWYF